MEKEWYYYYVRALIDFFFRRNFERCFDLITFPFRQDSDMNE